MDSCSRTWNLLHRVVRQAKPVANPSISLSMCRNRTCVAATSFAAELQLTRFFFTILLHLKDNLPQFSQINDGCLWRVGLSLARHHRSGRQQSNCVERFRHSAILNRDASPDGFCSKHRKGSLKASKTSVRARDVLYESRTKRKSSVRTRVSIVMVFAFGFALALQGDYLPVVPLQDR